MAENRLDLRVASAVAAYRGLMVGDASLRAHSDNAQELVYDETRHTLALRGVIFTEREIETVLGHGVAPRGRAVRDCVAAIGHAAALRWAYQYGEGNTPSARDVRTLYDLSRGAVDRVAARFVPLSRTAAAAAAVAVRDVAAPTPTVKSLGRAEARCFAALGHDAVLTRLVVNLTLVRAGCPPIVLTRRDAATYARLVREYGPDTHAALGALLARCLLNGVDRFSTEAEPALVPLAGLAEKRVSADALRVAAVRGRLRARKGRDGVWRSTRSWVDDYLGTRYVRTPTSSA